MRNRILLIAFTLTALCCTHVGLAKDSPPGKTVKEFSIETNTPQTMVNFTIVQPMVAMNIEAIELTAIKPAGTVNAYGKDQCSTCVVSFSAFTYSKNIKPNSLFAFQHNILNKHGIWRC